MDDPEQVDMAGVNLAHALNDEIQAIDVSKLDKGDFSRVYSLQEFLANPESETNCVLYAHTDGAVNRTEPTEVEKRLYTLAQKTLSPTFSRSVANPHNPAETWSIYTTGQEGVFMVSHVSPSTGQPGHNLVSVSLDRQPTINYINARTGTHK